MRCTKCSDGCLNCWHLKMCDRFKNNPQVCSAEERVVYGGSGGVLLREDELLAPAKRKKPAVIGVQFMGDLFHGAVPDKFITAAYMTIYSQTRHTFLILTKRPTRMAERLNTIYRDMETDQPYAAIAENVYHGLTICSQPEADEKIPIFLQVPGKKFLSIEPCLGAINLSYQRLPLPEPADEWLEGIDAVILGGETGSGVRPLHPDWVRSIRDQCQSSGVPFFFKGWGEYIGIDYDNKYPDCWKCSDGLIHREIKEHPLKGTESIKVGRNKAGRLLDGKEHNDLPWVKEGKP